MPMFSEISKARLATCHPWLIKLFEEVIKEYDCSIICGERTKEEQDRAVAEGFSKAPWPTSAHNKRPSMAVDVAPFPLDWSEREHRRFYHFGGYVLAVAQRMNIPIRWGGDWNGNMDFKDQTFNDLPHFQLILEDIPEKEVA